MTAPIQNFLATSYNLAVLPAMQIRRHLSGVLTRKASRWKLQAKNREVTRRLLDRSTSKFPNQFDIGAETLSTASDFSAISVPFQFQSYCDHRCLEALNKQRPDHMDSQYLERAPGERLQIRCENIKFYFLKQRIEYFGLLIEQLINALIK